MYWSRKKKLNFFRFNMFLTAIVFFVILGILVLIHELGHFMVARLFGVRVEEFGFGLPPRIWGKKLTKKGTLYSINWLPLGGFVRLAGEDDPPSHKASGGKLMYLKKEYFWAKTKKQRTAILLAGVTMNFLLAVGITTYLLTQGVYEASGRVHIETVVAGSPASAAGLKTNDIIEKFKTSQDLVSFVKLHAGKPIKLTIQRNNKESAITLVPRTVYPKGEGPTGISISDLELKTYSWLDAPFAALKLTISRAGDMFSGLWNLIVRIAHLQSVGSDVAGPIGIAQVTGTAVKFGFKAVLEFMSILSLNLAVLNVLPIPALDGGRVLFVFLEKILGKRIKPAFERSTHQIGMLVLFVLIALISLNDILRIARGG
jgi:regulator of sigma E protease